MVRASLMIGRTVQARAATLAVLLAMAAVVLDAGFVNVALPTVSRSLGVAPDEAVAVVTAYQAAILAGLLPCAQISARFGHRRLFIGGLATFSGASIACALAVDLPMLVAARVIQGLGGAAIMALGIALLRQVLGTQGLGRAIGWNALTVALSSAVAPLLGAFMLAIAPWPALFLVKLPVCAAALVAACALPQDNPAKRPIDSPAIVLHGAVAALIVVAAGIALGRPMLAMSLAVIAIALAHILFRRAASRADPLWPVDLLAQRPFRASVVASICCFTAQSAGLVALPFHLQLGLGHGPVAAGIVLACWPITVALASMAANRLVERVGSAALCMAGGLALAAGLLFSAFSPAIGGIFPIAFGSAFCGLGFGLFQVPNNRTLFLTVPAERSVAAGGMQGTARLAGQTLGALLMGLIFACAPAAIAPRIGFAAGSVFAIAAALVSAREVRLFLGMRHGVADAKP